jgi:hypothetical protein
LQQWLIQFLAISPGYEWRIEGGVLDVLPAAQTAAENDLLSFPVNHFYTPTSSPEAVSFSLRRAVEAELNPEPPKTGGAVSILSTPIEGDWPLSMENTSVRRILDSAVRRSNGLAAWVIPPLVGSVHVAMKSRSPWYLATYSVLLRDAAALCTPKDSVGSKPGSIKGNVN